MSSGTRLRGLRDEQQRIWQDSADRNVRRLFVVTSGYEARSRAWAASTFEYFDAKKSEVLVCGFTEHANAASRPDNDRFYTSRKSEIISCASQHETEFLSAMKLAVEHLHGSAGNESVEIHVDYSCMPRRWYCGVPLVLSTLLRNRDRVFMWYTPGIYPDPEYPTAGVTDFTVFSGRPSLSPRFRTHMFGLGFDKVRSAAICSVLDPQNLICFYADPAADLHYAERVRSDNIEVLNSANDVLAVPLREFVTAYSMLGALVEEFRAKGDVVLVPDGPKPLIMAASLIPHTHGADGVVCFHVTRGKAPNFVPVDVKPCGEACGFSFSGSRTD